MQAMNYSATIYCHCESLHPHFVSFHKFHKNSFLATATNHFSIVTTETPFLFYISFEYQWLNFLPQHHFWRASESRVHVEDISIQIRIVPFHRLHPSDSQFLECHPADPPKTAPQPLLFSCLSIFSNAPGRGLFRHL